MGWGVVVVVVVVVVFLPEGVELRFCQVWSFNSNFRVTILDNFRSWNQGKPPLKVALHSGLESRHYVSLFFFNHLAATNVTGFSETLSLAEKSLILAKKSRD